MKSGTHAKNSAAKIVYSVTNSAKQSASSIQQTATRLAKLVVSAELVEWTEQPAVVLQTSQQATVVAVK